MRLVILNELDAASVTYGSNTKNVDFWWRQVEKMAGLVKESAPDKIVGIAVHDDPNICGVASSYMGNCPSVDFWGVNTYQTSSFESVFDNTPQGPGYSGLTEKALKPVIITEYGFPTTTRQDPCDPSGIHQTPETIQKVADIVGTMIPKAYNDYPINTGLFYFEYCDELWNQAAYTIPSCGSELFNKPNVYTMYGGQPAAGFPNGYLDQDRFGLYTTERGSGKTNSDPIWCAHDSI
ncbi:MAG: hypothetical protein WBB45_00205 [Cyclobacteriaceae bacterium]